jgi:hypothetical protein
LRNNICLCISDEIIAIDKEGQKMVLQNVDRQELTGSPGQFDEAELQGVSALSSDAEIGECEI